MMQIFWHNATVKPVSIRFGSNNNNDADPAPMNPPGFSRSKDYFLYQCGQNRDTEPFASFAASYLNTALIGAFGKPNPYQALASDDEASILLTINPNRLSRLNEILASNLFDPQGDRWALQATEYNDLFILQEKINYVQTGLTETREIPVILALTQN